MSDDWGKPTAQWTDPSGGVLDLTNISPDLGWFTTQGPAGWGAPPYDLTTDPVPRGGESVRNVRSAAARITWPLHIFGDSYTDFLANWRTVRTAFMRTVHQQTPGTLRVTFPDGSAREVDCFYQEGFGGAAGENWLSANPVLTLYAPDGYWRDPVQQVTSRAFAATSSFLNPFPRVSSAQVLGSTIVTNPGDATAWPQWTVTGPGTTITAINNTTGKQFVLSYPTNPGELITITTQRPMVRGPLGQNLINALNWPTAYLWGLEPGDNSVSFAVSGAAAGTAIQLAFYARYEGV